MSTSADRHVSLRPDAVLVPGTGAGDVLASTTPLSFWGGVDATTGTVISRHHPLHGQGLAGRVLVIPHGRGSCTGSAVLLEIIHAGVAPAVIVLNRADDIIALGAIVAEEILHRQVPVVVLDDAAFVQAMRAREAWLDADGILTLQGLDLASDSAAPAVAASPVPQTVPATTDEDRRLLAGERGRAAQVAMRIVVRMAALQGAERLIDVSRVHIDCCIYTGPAGLAFAEQMADWNGRVAVPTTLNAISIDRRHWRAQGVPESLGLPAERLAHAYDRLGAGQTYTCAPYLLEDTPGFGENIAWAESNAVVYANSVLGARTNKTPDLLDTCIALTGRAPDTGYYRDAGRRATVLVEVPGLDCADDALYPLLGYAVGAVTDGAVPVVAGLAPGLSKDALRAFGAAFATTGSAGMFHIAGSTPEAPTVEAALGSRPPARELVLGRSEIEGTWREFNSTDTLHTPVDLVALGNPHFSYEEFAALAALCAGRQRNRHVRLVVTTNRHVAERARRAGFFEVLDQFGAEIVTDTCWCMLGEPIVTPSAHVILTNSAKYAHYGPGLVKRRVRYAGLRDCVAASIAGAVSTRAPAPAAGR